MKPALFTPAAEADVEEAFQWYESQRKGLGAAFRHAVDIAVAALESNPDGYTVIQPEHEARPSTEVPVWALLPCSRRSHRRGRLHSRETTSKDLALSLRPANNRLKLTAVRWQADARPQLKRVLDGRTP